MNITKENAVEKCFEIILNSWTWARLTPPEAGTWTTLIRTVEIKGTAKQCYAHAMNLYRAFLAGCGYDAPYWREPADSDAPKF